MRGFNGKLSLATGLAAMLSALPAAAQDQAPQGRSVSSGGTYSFTIENDIFGDDDKDYTNGVRIDYITPRNDLNAFGRWAHDQLNPTIQADDWYMIYALGQSMFTPTDISDPNPGRLERPYAGFLYGSVGVVADTGRRLHTFALDVGVVGPLSGAEQTQKFVHDIGDFTKPVGWDQQLENEPAFRLIYEQKGRAIADIPTPFPLIDLQTEVLPHASFALGTLDTSAALGLTFRIGEDLADDYGPPRVRPAVGGPGFFSADNTFGWYLFAGAEGRVVGRNLFLEGNTFGGRDGVTINRFVGDLQFGAAVQVGSVEMSYTHVYRSEEYAAQDSFAEFGSFNIRTQF